VTYLDKQNGQKLPV